MRSGKWYSLHTVLLSVAIAGVLGSGCRKSDGTVDNDSILQTPYSVYFADRQGGLYNTNDGQAYKIMFPRDGVAGRSLLASGPNLLWAKVNLHLSTDNGRKFNPVNRDIVGRAEWHSLMINGYNKTFLATNSGILETNDNGLTWEASPMEPGVSANVHSFGRINSGQIYGVDAAGGIFEKPSQAGGWRQVSVTSSFPGGTYHLSNYNNLLIAGDATGANGVWYSGNNGQDWAQYAGLPTNQEIRSMHAPLGQAFLVGTDSAGIYRLVGNSFEPSNAGLTPFTTVYGITSKQDIYKNEVVRQYVYIATSTGLYRSEDLGQNWALMRGGDIRNIY